MANEPPLPDGISEKHVRTDGRFAQCKGILSLIGLGGLLLAALSGVMGGSKNPELRRSGPSATISVTAPEILRNGEFFELRIAIEAKRLIPQPTVGVSSSYWRDLTINTMIPAADKESFADGVFQFQYPALNAGDRLEIKIDGQVNPTLFGGTKGFISLSDDETEMERIPLTLRVLP